MVLGWRRAFSNSVPKDRDGEKQHCNTNSPKMSSKLGFFSNPSTPRLPVSNSCVPTSPTLHTKPQTPKKKSSESPRLFNPSSPSFSLLKSTLRISTKRSVCGICSEAVKSGRGTAIFTGECCHDFHFTCIASHFKNHRFLQCPICNTCWKEPPLLPIQHHQKPTSDLHSTDLRHVKIKPLRVYDDDEPLVSPTAGGRFNPIPESDEEDEDDGPTEFQGFFVNPKSNSDVEVSLIPEVAVGRGSETCVVRMKVKAPPARKRRPPVDLVALLQVGGAANLETLKRVIGLLISSLSESDRLSIVAFSGGSKRLLPLRRMSAGGQRAARGIVNALRRAGEGMCVGDAIKKAVKVLEDRRHRNSAASIVLFSDGRKQLRSSTRLYHADVPVHAVNVDACGHAPSDATLGGLLSFVVRDLRLELGFEPGPGPILARVVAVYSLTGEPEFLGSDLVRLGDFVAEEERELLVEFTCPCGPHLIMSVRPSFKDPSSGVLVYSKEQAVVVPRPQAVRSSSPSIERLRNLHVTVRAVAESRRLVERGDFSGAHRLLSSARAVLMKSRSAEELLCGLEAEEAELHRRRLKLSEGEEKSEALTPTSAWRAAEKLAKLAVMKKSVNRVSDLHGFENARF